MGILDSIIGAAGPIIGGLIGESGQQDTNSANAALAQSQDAFQENMSSTAYERAVKDMEAAGLNPMLAYQQGGASSPTGATIAMQNPAAGMTAAFSNASSAWQSQQQIDAQSELARQGAEEKKRAMPVKDVEGGVARKLERGLDAIEQGASAAGEGAAAAVQKVKELVNGLVSSASSPDGVDRAAGVARDVGQSVPALGAAQRATSSLVNSASDVVEAGKRGYESMKRGWDYVRGGKHPDRTEPAGGYGNISGDSPHGGSRYFSK